MAIDNWVNLNDVYVPTNGGSVNGDLGVKGTLTVDDKTGNNTTYDVANEITALRDSTSKLNVRSSINHVSFEHNKGNDHREIWFDDTCIYFNMDSIGVYNSITQQGFYIPKPQHSISSTFIDCKLNNMSKPIIDAAASFGRYQNWGNPGITATINPYGSMIIQVTTALPTKIPWSCIFVCKQYFDIL